jgi:Serine/threonine protein kinase
MADRSGQRLGNYTLMKLVGQGGFAEVYLAEHQYLKSYAAIKILQAKLSGNDDMDSFLLEAQTIARLSHPNIIRVMDFGVESETPYLVMDYATNGTLRQRHPRGVQIPLATIMPYVKQVSEALQYAHDEHLIHRDIKPENMLVGRRNEILLSDFGIALVAQSSRYQGTQDVIGTAAYMSPEQIQGRPRPASDQYSLGIVIYEWLTGERPFHGTFTEMCTQHMFATPQPLTAKVADLPPTVEQVILRALEKDPHNRYESMNDFAQAFELAVGNIPMERTQQATQSGVTYSTIAMGNSTQNTPLPGGVNGPTQLISPTQNVIGTGTQQQATPEQARGTLSSSQAAPWGSQTTLQQGNQPLNPQRQGFLSNAGPNATLHSSATEMQTSLNAQGQSYLTPGKGNQFAPQNVGPSHTPNPPIPTPTPQDQPLHGLRPGLTNPAYPSPFLQAGQPGQAQRPAGQPASPYGGYGQPQPPYNQAQQYQQQPNAFGAQPSPQQAPYAPQQQASAYKQPSDNAYRDAGQPAKQGYQPSHNAEQDRSSLQREQEYRATPSSAKSQREEQLEQSASVESDWFDLGSIGPWKWKVLATILGLVLFSACYALKVPIRNQTYFIVLVIPLFFGGAFGPLAGGIVGAGGALLASMFYQNVEPYRLLFPVGDYYNGLSWWQPWLFYGLAGVATGLAMLGRRRLPSIGSCIRSALLAIIILGGFVAFIAFSAYPSKYHAPVLLSSGIVILVNVIIAFAVLVVYSIIAHLIGNEA